MPSFLKKAYQRTLELVSQLNSSKVIAMRNERAIISFTFDDFPHSAATNGARLLEKHGLCGTFYVAGSLCGQIADESVYYDKSDLSVLSDVGHEIGCHTFGHVRVSSLDQHALDLDLDSNARFVADIVSDLMLVDFAYPFGDISPFKKQNLQRRFATCRSTVPGLNYDRADLGMLKSIRLYDDTQDLASLRKLIDKALDKKAWLIFYTHEVEEFPHQYGCTISLFEEAVKMAIGSGAAVLTVRNAVGAIRHGLG